MTRGLHNKTSTSRTGNDYPPIKSTRQYGKIKREHPWDTGEGVSSPNYIPNSTNLTGLWIGNDGGHAYDSIGIDGKPNTATSVTDISDVLNGYQGIFLIDQVPVAVNARSCVLRYFIRKELANQLSGLLVGLWGAGESCFAHYRVDLTTGALTFAAGDSDDTVGYDPVEVEANDYNDEYIEVIARVSGATSNLNGEFHIYPSFDALGSGQGTAVIGNLEVYYDITIADIRGTAPVYTTAAVTPVIGGDPGDPIVVTGTPDEVEDESTHEVYELTPEELAEASLPVEGEDLPEAPEPCLEAPEEESDIMTPEVDETPSE